jgi:hypothetical protein
MRRSTPRLNGWVGCNANAIGLNVVECTFEDGKSECGMADYQVRKWSAWHHHMTLVMMTMLFMLTEKFIISIFIRSYPVLTLKSCWLIFSLAVM